MPRKLTFLALCAAAALFGAFFHFASAQVATTTLATDPSNSSSSLQGQLDYDNQQIATLNQQIAQYQAQLQQIGSDKKTLQAAIQSLDLQKSKIQTQVTLTQKQIDATQVQIKQLGNEIMNTEQSIVSDEQALVAFLQNLQKADDQSLLMKIIGSGNLSDAWGDVNATLQMQDSIRASMQTLQAQKNTLSDSKNASQQKQVTLASQEQSLTAQQQSLLATVQSKNQLLAATKAEESNYQKLLADAEAQLNSFSAFVQNAGGAKLLGNQTVCDNWGCYFNQRDTTWGADKLDGTSFTLASDGCLVTSMAMVLTHYGYRDVTPVTINSDPGNFASYYPAYLLISITVDGVTATRKTTSIDATLASGNPVIVGLHAYGGTHYVVLVSGSKGNYIMKDPYVQNGNDVPFTDHYSMREIFGITKVVIS